MTSPLKEDGRDEAAAHHEGSSNPSALCDTDVGEHRREPERSNETPHLPNECDKHTN